MPPTPPPLLEHFIQASELESLIRRAIQEDLGSAHQDLTSSLLIPSEAAATAVIRSRVPGTVAGLILLPVIVRLFDPQLHLELLVQDTQSISSDQSLARLHGRLRSILALERITLNFLSHLSGIATLTSRFVQAVAGTSARITDTRKTLPGLRALEKYAVVCGGGLNHRMGLFDAVLVKDNHLAFLPPQQLASTLARAVQQARQLSPPPAFIEIEADRLDQLPMILAAGPDLVLLDNMSLEELTQAVQLRNRLAPHILLEASGGITLDNVRAVAQTGVDRISVGALTHSAPALDLTLELV